MTLIEILRGFETQILSAYMYSVMNRNMDSTEPRDAPVVRLSTLDPQESTPEDERQMHTSSEVPPRENTSKQVSLPVATQVLSLLESTKGNSTTHIQPRVQRELQEVPSSLADILSGQEMQCLSMHTLESWKNFLNERKLPLTESQLVWLTQNHMELIERVDVHDVLDYLVQDGLCTDDEQHRIWNHTCPGDSMRDLLSHIKTRGQRAFYSFVRALQQTSPVLKRWFMLIEVFFIKFQSI